MFKFQILTLLFISTSWGASASDLSCQSILISQGKGQKLSWASIQKKAGSRLIFNDKFYQYSIEITEKGLFLQLTDKNSKREIIVKADLRDNSPYFDLIIPIHSNTKKLAKLEELELECM